MLLADLINQIATDLNDAEPGHEFTSWTQEQLTNYALDALQIIFVERPDLFSEKVVLRVAPCTTIQELCGCDRITNILGQSDRNGRLLKVLRKRKEDSKLQWPGGGFGSNCEILDPGKYVAQSFSIDTDLKSYRIYPSPPFGTEIYVLAECYVKPDTVSGQLSDELIPAIREWILRGAKMMDAENNAAIFAVAKAHETTFWDLIARQEKRRIEDKTEAANA